MLLRTKGIVLKNYPYGEADLLVTYLTEDAGIIKAFAKSPRKTKSRFGSSLEPLTYARISLFGREDSKILRLTQSDIIEPFHEIREELWMMESISRIIDLTLRIIPERQRDNNVFKLFFVTLKNFLLIREELTLKVLKLFYTVRLLAITGFSPKLDVCVRCGEVPETFNLLDGSLLCRKCLSFDDINNHKDGFITLSRGARRFYKSLLEWNLRSILRIKPSRAILYEVENLLQGHMRYHVIQTEGLLLPHPSQDRVSQEV